jgi:hypothetical protein
MIIVRPAKISAIPTICIGPNLLNDRDPNNFRINPGISASTIPGKTKKSKNTFPQSMAILLSPVMS